MSDNWDEEKVFDEEIVPLMKQLMDACDKRRIPALVSFVFAQTGPFMGVVCVNQDFDGRRVPQFDAFRATVEEGMPDDGKSTITHEISLLKPGN